jgi:uroporphyrinogen-III decarboxylase
MSIDRRKGGRGTDRLIKAKFDFDAHNEEVSKMWDAFWKREPLRIPITLGINSRYYMQIPEANSKNVNFERYSENPGVMFDSKLEFERWKKFNLLFDEQLGLPDVWTITVDFQNYYEAAWFGCKVHYMDGEVPDTRPDFAAVPEKLMDKGIPDPFSGLMGKAIDYHQNFRIRAAKEEFLGSPVKISDTLTGTDGPMTVACNLFGPQFVCETMASDAKRFHTLMKFVAESVIARTKAWRKYFNVSIPQDGFGFADDSIALISTNMYREHVMPYHKVILDAFATDKPRGIHLCGDATRHFKTLRDELNIWSFDTGFPVDFGKLRKQLGPEVQIQGGPHVEFLISASPGQVRDEVKRILGSGVLEGGRFILREGNNLAPRTPVDNTDAMYKAGREFGKLK